MITKSRLIGAAVTIVVLAAVMRVPKAKAIVLNQEG